MLGVGTSLERSARVRLPGGIRLHPIGGRGCRLVWSRAASFVMLSRVSGSPDGQRTAHEITKRLNTQEPKTSSLWWLYLHRLMFAAFQL